MGNMTLEQVNDMYLDVLREIGNIGQEMPLQPLQICLA